MGRKELWNKLWNISWDCRGVVYFSHTHTFSFCIKNYVKAEFMSCFQTKHRITKCLSPPGSNCGRESQVTVLKMLTRGIYFNEDINFRESPFLLFLVSAATSSPTQRGIRKWDSGSGLLMEGNTWSPHLKQLDFLLFECRKPNYTLVNSLQSTKHRKKQ